MKKEEFLKSRERTKISKLMSYILRHAPWEFDVGVDEEGFASIEEVVRAVKKSYPWVKKEQILWIVENDPKGRFEIRGDKIRARYGHSFDVSLNHEEDVDVRILYHGTPRRNLKNILREGIKSMKRKFVHLTTSKEEAYETGRRYGRDVVIIFVDAECLRKKGYKIYKAGKNVRIVKFVPPECIIFYEQPKNSS